MPSQYSQFEGQPSENQSRVAINITLISGVITGEIELIFNTLIGTADSKLQLSPQ